MTAYVLVLNAGSSSLKYQLLEPDSGRVAVKGIVERIGSTGGGAVGNTVGGTADYASALAAAREEMSAAGFDPHAVDLRAIGHRVVHGGERFRRPTLITPDVLQTVRDLIPLAPLHNPANAALIECTLDAFPAVPQVAVFDTAFFAALPEVAATYAIDRGLARKYGIRRYGFHGISHCYVSRAAAAHVGRPYAELNQIVLHLGNGASASAIAGGRALDTSMGLTPLEGLVMGSRGGDIDPGVLIHLMRAAHLDADGLEDLLSRPSGMKGLTGTVDLRDVHGQIAAGGAGAQQAELALDIYTRRLRKYIGAYHAILGRLDTLIFTAGVGENDPIVRARAVENLAALGISIDPDRNVARAPASSAAARIISPDGSPVTVLVVPTNEELAIAQQSAALIGDPSAKGARIEP